MTCLMTNDMTTWRALAALPPPGQAREILDLCTIGEQEAALAELVSGLIEHGVPIAEAVRVIAEAVRVQLAVMAEDWGSRDALEGRIQQCRPAFSPHSRLHLRDSHERRPFNSPGTGRR